MPVSFEPSTSRGSVATGLLFYHAGRGTSPDDILTSALEQLSASSGALGCNADNPLADIVCIDLGAVRELNKQELQDRNLDFGDGTVGREASAATIRVLPIAADSLGGDVLALRLGTSTAAANATPKAITPAVQVVDRLPKTGTGTNLALGLAMFLGAGGAATLIRRSRSAAA